MEFKTEGKYAGLILFDDEDMVLLFGYRWITVKRSSRCFYAVAKAKNNGPLIYMHRLIMNPKPGELIDHKNGNGLDNRRCNLRTCSKLENQRYQAPNNGADSKGVYFSRRANLKKRWVARITVNYKSVHLGYFIQKTRPCRHTTWPPNNILKNLLILIK